MKTIIRLLIFAVWVMEIFLFSYFGYTWYHAGPPPPQLRIIITLIVFVHIVLTGASIIMFYLTFKHNGDKLK